LVEPVAPPPVYVTADATVHAEAVPLALHDVRPALSPAAVRLSDPLPTVRRAAAPRAANGKSRAVVQLGAYSSRDRIAAAWSKVSARHGTLKRYVPVTARFSGAQGTVYRLAIKGFASNQEATNLCASLRRAGGSCFVRAVSGDAPVQFASR
jgi:cell division septation protein DedD